MVLKHENLNISVQVVAHQAVSLRWLSYRLLRCILSCNKLEKKAVLTLIFFTQTRRMNDLLNPFRTVAAVLFYCMLAGLCGIEIVSDIYWSVTFFRKYGCFLNFVALNISVALNTWVISSHSETQALKQAEQQPGLIKSLFYNHSQFTNVTTLCPRTIRRPWFLDNV